MRFYIVIFNKRIFIQEFVRHHFKKPTQRHPSPVLRIYDEKYAFAPPLCFLSLLTLLMLASLSVSTQYICNGNPSFCLLTRRPLGLWRIPPFSLLCYVNSTLPFSGPQMILHQVHEPVTRH